jgi:hypothetical protein
MSEDTKLKSKNRSYYNKKKEDVKYISDNEDDEFGDNSSYSKYRLSNASPDGLHEQNRARNKSQASIPSIPSKCRRYKLVRYPEIKFRYKIPGYPECYLLPIRFPKLHTRIISDLLKCKTKKHYHRNTIVDAQ